MINSRLVAHKWATEIGRSLVIQATAHANQHKLAPDDEVQESTLQDVAMRELQTYVPHSSLRKGQLDIIENYANG